MRHRRTLFIFRQDLRLEDNTALREAITHSQEVFPIFIRDDRSVRDFGKDDPRFGFIREMIDVINTRIGIYGGKISVYSGDPTQILSDLIGIHQVDAVYVNKTYSPRGKQRDRDMEHICQERGVHFFSFQDFLLIEPQDIPSRKVFTPYSTLWKKFLLQYPERTKIQSADLSHVKWFVPDIQSKNTDSIDVAYHPFWTHEFGLQRLQGNYDLYDTYRNIPSVDGSTRISPYIRFGVFSVRQIYQRFAHQPVLLNEIIWREFWYHIAHYFPETYDLEFQQKRRSLHWENDIHSYEYEKFVKGETGYPLIDAAIRQLYETNWMHNRLRMVVASFLTKNLGFDWRIGEQWFKKYLIDYDEAVNIGNWQWSASVGADPKPVRIFNPLLQSEKFDTDARFIHRYIPELAHIDPKKIHTLDLAGVYHRPIVDQKISANEAKKRYFQ